MDLIKTKKWLLINTLIFYTLLSYGYYFFFYIFQNYTNKIGFELHVNYFKCIEGIVIILLVALFYIYNDINESVYLAFTFILFIFIIVPSASYYFLSNNSREYFYLQILSIIILNLGFIINRRFTKNTEKEDNTNKSLKGVNKYQKAAKYTFLGIIGAFMLTDVVIFLKYGHSLLYLFNLDKVYGIRIASRAEVPKKLGYIISWSAMVIVPSSIAWFVKIKKYYLIIIPAVIQILIFTIGGTKSHLFTLILVSFIFILYTWKKLQLFLPFLNFLMAITLLLKNAFIMAVVIRRAFFFPQSISYNYYKFFTQFPQLHLSNSILKSIYHNQYKIDIPFIISRYIYKTPVMSANTNYIANAFANYGALGVITFSIILALILIVIERICFRAVNKKYMILITFCSFFAVVNSALLTVMLTHGLLVSLVIGFIFFGTELKIRRSSDI